MRKGFIGLGHLGKAMALRLLDCGHDLKVYNRTADKALDMNAGVFDSPRDLAEHSDVIFVCLTDTGAVKSLFEGTDSLVDVDICGKVIVDFTTHDRSGIDDIYALAHRHGALYMECPVLGSVVPARAGTLTLVAGGDARAYEKVKALLADLASHVFFLEKPGQATTIKLLNNMILASLMISLTEALAFAEDQGMDKKEVLGIMVRGAGSSVVLTGKRDKLENEDFSSHFSNALLYKDLSCARDMAQDLGKILFSADFAREIYARAFEKHIEDLDFSSVYKLFQNG